ncbi:uncharacterized protein E0L32_010473, partial [Thyridium curvatum]
MPGMKPPAQAALLTWVNTFPLDRKVERLEDLSDGRVFSQMLQDLDPEYDPSELELNVGSSTWLTKKRNIQSVFKALTKYIVQRDTSDKIVYLPRTVDFRSLSDDLDAEGISQLLCVFAAATLMGEKNEKYIPIMYQNLSQDELASIAGILEEKQKEMEKAAKAEESTGATPALDAGLETEAELARLASEYDTLTKKLADSNTRLEHLQIAYEEVKDELQRAQDNLELEQQKHGDNESQTILSLQRRNREQEEIIETQEAQIEDDRQTKTRLTHENNQLNQKAELFQRLQDEVQELKHEKEELAKKANTAERYRQKLESQRGMETDLKNALYELDTARDNLREYDRLKDQCEQQATSITRFRDMVAALEQQLEDSRIKKLALEEEIYAVQAQLERIREQKLMDERRILELEEQVLHGVGGVAGGMTPDGSKTNFNLEEELEHSNDPSTAMKLEISRLRAENNLLKHNIASGDNKRLHSELETSRQQQKILQGENLDILKKFALAQDQINALMSNSTDEGLVNGIDAALAIGPLNVLTKELSRSEIYRKISSLLKDRTFELEEKNSNLQKLERQVADRDRELLTLRTDRMLLYHIARDKVLAGSDHDALLTTVSAVEKGSVDALQELKATDELVSGSLKDEVEVLRKQLDELKLSSDTQQKQLFDSLLTNEKLRTKLDDATREPRVASPKPDEVAAGAAGRDPAGLEEALRRKDEKLEKVGTRAKQLKEVSRPALPLTPPSSPPPIRPRRAVSLRGDEPGLDSQLEKAEQEKYDLQRRLKAAEHAGSAAAQKAASDQIIKNLQRENAMIATAWYDLTSRLQSNHVVLQRRQDMPKSWLNKQRHLVN